MQEVPIFTVNNLGYSTEGNVILDGVNVEIAQGAYVGVIGPNGGGKTTFLKILLGLLEPTEGSVKCAVKRSEIGYVPQRPPHSQFPATVSEIIGSGQTGTPADSHALRDAVDVTGVDYLLERQFSALSGGEKQRVLIARALAGRPKVLMLDEPTSAVDARGQEAFYAFLQKLRKKFGLTILLVSHDTDVIAHEVDEVLCLNRHLICHGPAEEIMHHPHLIHGHK